MAKFDVQTLKKHIASVIEIHRDMRREVCDANEKLVKELKDGSK
jgi:hypothetical protein